MRVQFIYWLLDFSLIHWFRSRTCGTFLTLVFASTLFRHGSKLPIEAGDTPAARRCLCTKARMAQNQDLHISQRISRKMARKRGDRVAAAQPSAG